MKFNKKKICNRAVAVTLSALMAFPTAMTGVHADGTSTIDTTKKGSITLYKFLDNNGKTVDATGVNGYGTTAQDILAGIRQEVDSEILPEKGVKFRTIKVADIEQVTEDTASGLNTTGTYYTNIDEGFFNIMNQYLGDDALVASESTKVTDGRTTDVSSHPDDHYESDELNAKILEVNRAGAKADGSDSVTGEVALNRYLRTNSKAQVFNDTDEDGYTQLNDLDLGLYLICEVDWEHSALSKHDTYWEYVTDGQDDKLTSGKGKTSDAGTENSGIQAGGKDAGGSVYADIASPSSPFLLSVPMTNLANITVDGKEYKPGTAWQYDIVAFPKNGTINIHKDIVTNEFAAANSPEGTAGTPTNDGNDTTDTKTTCNLVQTNYLANGTSLDKQSGLVHQIDANIGDVITQLVSVDVPRLTDDIDNEQPTDVANRDTVTRKHNKTFIVRDRMTKGLKLIDNNSFKVTLTSSAWNDPNATQFVEGTDFDLTFADDKQSYVLTVKEEGLKKMDDISSASYLYVLYNCEVTKDALVGTDTYGNQRHVVKTTASNAETLKKGNINDTLEIDDSKTDTSYDVTYPQGSSDGATDKHPEATNQNTAQLTYATDRTMEHDYYSNTTKVFTYELDLTKVFTDGTAGYVSKNDTNDKKNSSSFAYSNVKFTVRGSVKDGSEHDVQAKAEGAPSGWEDLTFIRTGDGTYRVWDKRTDGGDYDADADTLDQAANEKSITRYVTPNSETGLLTIIGLDARTYELTERATAKGRNLMADPFYVELVAPVKGGKTLEDGSIEHAYVWTGTKPTDNLTGMKNIDLATYDINKARLNEGRTPVTVQNNEVIKVLRTGGAGTIMFYVAGGSIITVALLFFLKKKKEEEANINE